MKTITVCHPAMCCPAGICGAAVDQRLVDEEGEGGRADRCSDARGRRRGGALLPTPYRT